MTKDAHITVLHTAAAPNGTAQFVVHLLEGAPAPLDLKFFSWKVALTGSYDVLHVHWPETLLRSKNSAKRVLLRFAVVLLLARARRRKIPIVRTLHNTQPHELGSYWERRLLEKIDSATAINIKLNPTTASPNHPSVTILHGHYRDRFVGLQKDSKVPGRILYFGLIRPYKGVEQLLEAFQRTEDETLSLHIVGKPTNELRHKIESTSSTDFRIQHNLAFVDDDVLVREITQAELIVLPYLQMHNSGALLAALSLDRAVLVPKTPANIAIADEVGQDWIYTFDGDLTAEIMSDALGNLRAHGPSGQPDLSKREWKIVGDQHYAVYEQAIDLIRR